MSDMARGFELRAVDRVIIGILAALHLANAIYLIGPWYLSSIDNQHSPLYTLFNGTDAVRVYGVFLLIDAFALIWSVWATGGRYHLFVLSNALLAGFLLRLYALMGVFLTSDSWRPPGYLSHAASVIMLAAYWVWVKVNERPTK